ncbi:cation:dicarboxylase symporter family transporter [Pelosinus sp. IPA-1]|uniref:L-cystine transporter n=1 Tax=Pelosinus sp. IPA-1 TaxID=3029569 RepID=UPI00243629DD|nr:cation:dicarboxylase symporter family transporter [Pelosinus sp. IPA-1]GMA97378.1 L-cystine uptake protein TcyP [Pelosinus sp. IPA-1]
MSSYSTVITNILAMLALVYSLYYMQRKGVNFGIRVMVGMVLGILFGGVLQSLFGGSSTIIKQLNSWFDLIGSGYVRLLKMIVMPLIIVSIISAITNIKDMKILGKAGGLIIGILLFTTAIAGLIGAGSSLAFHLSAEGLQVGEAELGATKSVEGKLTAFQTKPIQQQLIEIIPTNPFYALTGQGSADTLSVVFFSALIGIAVLSIKQSKPQSAEFFMKVMKTANDVVMQLVDFVLLLTPYGVLALMTKFVSTSNYADIYKLIQFVVASYLALILMFIVHLIILSFMGFNPFTYIKKVIPVLIFAFTSRTSAGTLPLTIEALINKLGVPSGYANLSASFGVSIGQNGCAGIYPAMLAVMVAPTVGINPLEISFLLKLVIIVAIGSFGIAGVGGGATFAALVVLSTMGLPVGIVGLLIAIEPLIDMGRTALNVSGAMIAGIASSKLMGEMDTETYHQEILETKPM